jgi:hypothetical protein
VREGGRGVGRERMKREWWERREERWCEVKLIGWA